MTRTPSVAERLDEYARARDGRPFSWPDDNCCHFPARWVLLREGRDPMEGYPVTETERAALRLIKRVGGDLRGVWRCLLDRDPLPSPLLAQVGDVVVLPMGDAGETSGICAGRDSLFVNPDGRVVRAPTDLVSAAFRVRDAGALG